MIALNNPSTNPFLFINRRIGEKAQEVREYKLSVTTSHTDEYQRRDGKDMHRNHRDFHTDDRWDGGSSHYEDYGDKYVWYER